MLSKLIRVLLNTHKNSFFNPKGQQKPQTKAKALQRSVSHNFPVGFTTWPILCMPKSTLDKFWCWEVTGVGGWWCWPKIGVCHNFNVCYPIWKQVVKIRSAWIFKLRVDSFLNKNIILTKTQCPFTGGVVKRYFASILDTREKVTYIGK